jgi:hypothetical protein
MIKTISSSNEKVNRELFFKEFEKCPIPNEELLANLGLFQKRQELTKQLFFYEIYKRIINVHGVVFEFGTRWGQNLVTLNNLRGILEPYNYSRKIIGFDTFEGFIGTSINDGKHEVIQDGAFDVVKGYEGYLNNILEYHETESPMSHVKKNEIIKGDARVELKKYLKNHPETIIAFAYFDMDIYGPTKDCLELIKPYLTKGSIIGFDELNDPHFPGETKALRESLGINNVSVERFPFCGIQSFVQL